MPILPRYREMVMKSVGAIFRTEDAIEQIVKEATGEDPFVNWTGRGLPSANQLSQIFAELEKTNKDRWLLTYVLVQAFANERLRELIVTACPETLQSLPKVDDRVTQVQQGLTRWLKPLLTGDLRHKFRLNAHQLFPILSDIASLLAYKSLHEALHRLQVQLAFQVVIPDFKGHDS